MIRLLFLLLIPVFVFAAGVPQFAGQDVFNSYYAKYEAEINWSDPTPGHGVDCATDSSQVNSQASDEYFVTINGGIEWDAIHNTSHSYKKIFVCPGNYSRSEKYGGPDGDDLYLTQGGTDLLTDNKPDSSWLYITWWNGGSFIHPYSHSAAQRAIVPRLEFRSTISAIAIRGLTHTGSVANTGAVDLTPATMAQNIIFDKVYVNPGINGDETIGSGGGGGGLTYPPNIPECPNPGLVFRSSFEAPVYLTSEFGGVDSHALHGGDQGYDFDDLDHHFNYVHQQALEDNIIETEIDSSTARTGSRSLKQTANDITGGSQNRFQWYGHDDDSRGPFGKATFSRRWIKWGKSVPELLGDSDNFWIMGVRRTSDYSVSMGIHHNGSIHRWRFAGLSYESGTKWSEWTNPSNNGWLVYNETLPFPKKNEWFLLEFFFLRDNDPDKGRAIIWIDGEVLFDIHNVTKESSNSAHRWFAKVSDIDGSGGANWPFWQHVDDMELWSCTQGDTSPPGIGGGGTPITGTITGDGILMASTNSDITIQNSVITGCGYEANQDDNGIEYGGADNVRIVNNEIFDCTTNIAGGCNNCESRGVFIENNDSYHTSASWASLDGAPGSDESPDFPDASGDYSCRENLIAPHGASNTSELDSDRQEIIKNRMWGAKPGFSGSGCTCGGDGQYSNSAIFGFARDFKRILIKDNIFHDLGVSAVKWTGIDTGLADKFSMIGNIFADINNNDARDSGSGGTCGSISTPIDVAAVHFLGSTNLETYMNTMIRVKAGSSSGSGTFYDTAGRTNPIEFRCNMAIDSDDKEGSDPTPGHVNWNAYIGTTPWTVTNETADSYNASAITWASSAPISLGTWVAPTTTTCTVGNEPGCFLFVAESAGTADATEPSWCNTLGCAVTDNGVIYRAALAPYAFERKRWTGPETKILKAVTPWGGKTDWTVCSGKILGLTSGFGVDDSTFEFP
jgi:hypothetical protein